MMFVFIVRLLIGLVIGAASYMVASKHADLAWLSGWLGAMAYCIIVVLPKAWDRLK